MAKKKRKTKKKQEEQKVDYSALIIGLILILMGILGIGYGFIGSLLKKCAMFLAGELWLIVQISLVFIGLYVIFKKKFPKFFTTKLIGFYIIFASSLIVCHYSYIKTYPEAEIINTTYQMYQKRVATLGQNASIIVSGDGNINIGGGMIGALGAWICSSWFNKTGTIIVLCVLYIIGSLFLGLNFGAIIDKIKKLKNNDSEEDEEEEEIEEEEPPKKEKPGLFERLRNKNKEEKESKKEDNLEEQIPITMSNAVQNEISTIPEPVNIPSNSNYVLPSLDLLDKENNQSKNVSQDFIRQNKLKLEQVLASYEIVGATVTEIHVGPAVTQFEVSVPGGTKLNKIEHLDKEIAMALAAKQVSIEAPIPGKSTVGIEIPNPQISAVKFKEIMGHLPSEANKMHIVAALGKDLMGKVQVMDITKTPHLLVAGSTGSGKSVCMNSIIGSILMRYKPDEVKLILVDPKKVEMSHYNGIPHLLCPVVNDPKHASATLQKVVAKMDERYDRFAEAGVKKIEEYNEYVDKKKAKDPSCNLEKMYYLVVIIDELADLMMAASKEVEASIQRITQLARAAGIHLIVATQRPSVNVITGVIKANIPSRISFAVASYVDSKTILDTAGAEKLLGRGDMLFMPLDQNAPTRIQGCYITDEETQRLIDHVKRQQEAIYDKTYENINTESSSEFGGIGTGAGGDDDDPLYNEIYDFAMSTGKISASLIQRKYRLGYNRAARIIDLMEERGVIGPQNGSKPREVLNKKENE